MADMIEKIAMGGLTLHGNIDMQITDPLTGRAYYKFEDHNLVLKGLYEYLKMLCIAALCSYDGSYTYRPMTCLGASRSSSDPVNSFDGFALGINSQYPTGNSTYPPANDSNYAALKCPVDRVVLTDGTEPEHYDHCKLYGNVVAEANLCTAAASGGKQGVFSYAKSTENMREIYRRWDWASANGNGELSRIHLCAAKGAFPFFNTSMSRSFLQANLIEGTMLGTYRNHIFTCIKAAEDAVIFGMYTVDIVNGTIEKETIEANRADMGLSYYPTGNYFKLIPGYKDNTVHFACMQNNNNSMALFYTYDLAAKQISAVQMSSPRETNIFWGYAAAEDNIVLRLNSNFAVVSFSLTTKTYKELHKNSYSESSLSDGYSEFDGRYLYFYNYQGCKMIDTETGSAAWSAINYLHYNRFSGNKVRLRHHEMDYIVGIYNSDTIPYVQIDCIPDRDASVFTMTERLLPEPVVKDNMPMYVGYTLEFE